MSDPESGISCDICINNLLAVANTKLLKDYAQIDQRLLQLAFLVKHWAKQRGVNETYRGTLSSYACVKIDDIHYTRISLFLSPPCSFLSLQIWVLIFFFTWTYRYVLMCINFLQQCEPKILPCLQVFFPHNFMEFIILQVVLFRIYTPIRITFFILFSFDSGVLWSGICTVSHSIWLLLSGWLAHPSTMVGCFLSFFFHLFPSFFFGNVVPLDLCFFSVIHAIQL